VVFLIAFFRFDELAPILGIAATGDEVVIANFLGQQIVLSLSALRAFLGGGIIFFEIMIVVLSVSNRILDTIRSAIRPIVTLLPLAAFLYSAYTTFDPIVRRLLPPPIGGESLDIAATVNSPAFSDNVLLTFGTMMLYLIVAWILGRGDSQAEIKALRAEVKKLRQRRG